ncbi:MAG: ABC transporter permease [Sedimentisphaerales bacterium]|nr:ABC transporter permease [Sedimentisphaerales bacterium]
MKINLSARYAFRSLSRHLRRTTLSILGVGVGCGLCLFTIAFIRGEKKMMVRAAAESGAGHLTVVPNAWINTRDNDLRLDNWESKRQEIGDIEGIRIVTPRAETDALLAFGTRMRGIQMTGVDPQTEPVANRLVQKLVEGRYLTSGETGRVVIGRTVTKRLDVALDDDLMVTVAGIDGRMSSAMLRIVGIIETGSRELDGTICHATLEQIQELTGRSGATQLTILLEKPENLVHMEKQLQNHMGDSASVLDWEELLPEMAAGVEGDKTWTRMIVIIIMTVVFLGIASAQLAAVLERRREFAVLSALGMKSGRLVLIMLIEGVVLGFAGALLGLVLGVPTAYYVATRGIDFSGLYGEVEMSMSNILFDPIFYGDFGWWLVPLSFVLALVATSLSSLYPAWYAARTDPAGALRVEQ